MQTPRSGRRTECGWCDGGTIYTGTDREAECPYCHGSGFADLPTTGSQTQGGQSNG